MQFGPLNETENLNGQSKSNKSLFLTDNEFLESCRTGDLTAVQHAICLLDSEVIKSNFNFILRRGAENGYHTVVNRLREIDALSAKVAASKLALRLTARNASFDALGCLVEIELVINKVAALGNRALCMAAENGHLDVVNCLLEIDIVSAHAADCGNKALDLALGKYHFNVSTRLLKERTILDSMKHHLQFHKRLFPESLKRVENMGAGRVLAAKILPSLEPRLPMDIVNKILTFAFHDVMCGKRDCFKPPKNSTGNAVATCSTINQFRNAVVNGKKP